MGVAEKTLLKMTCRRFSCYQLPITSLLDFGVACEGEEGFQLASISEEPSAVGRKWGALPPLFRAVLWLSSTSRQLNSELRDAFQARIPLSKCLSL